MRNPRVKVGAVFLLMLAMSASSPPANAQDQLFRNEDGRRESREKRADKLDFLYKASNVYLFAGTSLDMVTTVQGLNHPEMARRTDGSVLGRYPGVETGWAGCFGRRNTFAVVSANVALNVGINLLSRKIYRRGGHWRILAVALNVLKGTDNMAAGFHNMKYASALDERIRATGYTGQIVWSRH